MRGAYSILGVVIVLVLLGVFALQSSNTKAYTSNEGSHKMELSPSSEAYTKHNFQPKGIANLIDSLSLEAVKDSIGE